MDGVFILLFWAQVELPADVVVDEYMLSVAMLENLVARRDHMGVIVADTESWMN